MRWQDRAACLDMTAIMYADELTEAARAVCSRCDVIGECLADTFQFERGLVTPRNRFGVRAGMTPQERIELTLTRKRNLERRVNESVNLRRTVCVGSSESCS